MNNKNPKSQMDYFDQICTLYDLMHQYNLKIYELESTFFMKLQQQQQQWSHKS